MPNPWRSAMAIAERPALLEKTAEEQQALFNQVVENHAVNGNAGYSNKACGRLM